MKKVLMVLISAASITAANAQTAFGVKAGANFASIGGDNDGLKSKVGFNVGAFANIPVSTTFSVSPELVFSAQGAAADEGDGKLNLNYINVPVLLQYNTPGGFFAQTGPQIGFLMSAKAKEDDEEVDLKDGLKSTDFSWAIGAGFKTASGFGFNARYNLGISNMIDDGGDDFKWKNNVIQVGVFYTFGGGATASK